MRATIRFFLSVFVISFAFGFAGCGDDTSSGSGGDMAATTVVHDLAMTVAHDLATETGDAGLKPLATACATGAECASGYCGTYGMGSSSTMLCTYMCTMGQPAPQCTTPGDGTCNGKGECKFPGMN